MKNSFLLITSVFICVLSSAQRCPPNQLIEETQPISTDSLHCMADVRAYCYNFAADSCSQGNAQWTLYNDSRGILTYNDGDVRYEYDADSNIISCTQLNIGGSWIEQDLYNDFTMYGAPIYLTKITFENNNVADTTRYKYAYLYNTNGQIVEMAADSVSIVDSTNWVEAELSYTANGNIDTMVQLWRWYDSWHPAYRYVFTYSANGYTVIEWYQSAYTFIDTTNGTDSVAWTTQDKSIHYYYPRTDGECATSGISSLPQNSVKIYPNPFTDKLTIEPNISYRLFDLVGARNG